MAGDTNGPTFQQWVGTYTTSTSSKSSRFSPLELKSDGTLLIAGQTVDFIFSGGESSISIGRFTLQGENGPEEVVGAKLNLKHEDARAKFTGSITAGQSGPVNFYGEQPTRELAIPNFWSDVKMSTAIHDGHLHVVGAMSVYDSYRGRMVLHRQFPLDRLTVAGDDVVTWSATPLSDAKHWSKELWQGDYWKNLPISGATDFTDDMIWGLKEAGTFGTYKWASSPRDEFGNYTNADITSLVSIGGKLYCFYTFSDSAKMSLRARRFTAKPGRNDGVWGEEMILFEPEDDTGQDSLLFHTGAVSVVAFNETQILVSACGTGDEANGWNNGPGYGQLMFYLFDISNTNNTSDGKGWAALSRRWVDVNKEVDFYLKAKKWPLENRTGAGLTIDADWFVSAVKGDKPGELVPVYRLAVNFGVSSNDAVANQHTKFTWQCHIPLEVEDAEGVSAGDIALKTNPWGKDRITAFSDQDGMHSSLKKDASGRLQYLSYFDQKTFSPDYTRTDQPVSAANHWGSANPTDKIDYYGTDDNTKPFNTFYTFSAGMTTEFETPGVNREGEKTTFPASYYPILEFICYGNNKIQLHDYGSIRMISDHNDIKQKNKNHKVYQIGGYFDGPVPFPLQNFVNVENLTGDVAEVATFEYGNAKETSQASSTESTWNVGMEADGRASEGVMLGFKASYEYEDITKKENEKASERESSLFIRASVSNPKPYKEPEAEADAAATTLTAKFFVTGFQFANRWGKITSDGLSKDPAQSPKLGRVLARTQSDTDRGGVSFEASLVTKGDLESYTAEAIDAKMGKHYVRDVICKNAYVFEGGQPYLMYTWTHGNMTIESSREMQKSFTSHEWSHGGEAYAGLTGGVGAKIFGMGFEYEFSVMAGGGYKREWSEESLTEAKWTIGADASEFDVPRPRPLEDGGDPDGVVEYSFRAYFLPVPTKPSTLPTNQWAKDLQDMLPEEPERGYTFTKDQVDTGFGCWRIFFLVTSINYREGSKKPNYTLPSDLEDVQSVYDDGP